MRVPKRVRLATAALTASALLAGCGSVGGSGEGGAVGDKNLKPEDETQRAKKGTKIGLLPKSEIFRDFRKIIRAPKNT